MVKNLNLKFSKQINNNSNEYAKKIIDLQLIIQPHLIIKYNKIQKEKFLEDIKTNLNFLASAIRIDSKEVYLNYIKWLAKLMKKLKIPIEELLINFKCMKQILDDELILEEYFIVDEYIDDSIKNLIDIYERDEEQNNVVCLEAKEFLNYLLNFEKQKAAKFILDKLENNVDIREVYIKYLQGALYEIGELWMEGKISVAKEHYCTALVQHIISLMYPYLFQNITKKGKVMFSVSAGNELHEIGIRMVTDFFELDGWDTFYLGSNMPIQAIIRELKEKKVDLLAISITMGDNIQFASDLISNIKSNEDLKDIKIIVGGRVFNEVKDLWKKINADGYGQNADESVRIGNELVKREESYMVKEG